MTVMKHFFRDLSLFSSPGVLSHILAYSILLCNKGWIAKLEEKEEILVVYFVGKAEGPERFPALCNNENSELEEKCTHLMV